MKVFPSVSIILPTYNRADLLSRAINSVLAQTYPQWKLIIWDDGSTDITREVVSSYSDGRIKYFHDQNHGVAFARNRAIEGSQEEYLAFLDSDDEWTEAKLSEQVKGLIDHPQVDIIFTDFLNVNLENDESSRAFERYSEVMKLMESEKLNAGFNIVRSGLLESLAIENLIATDTVMVRRDLLKRMGGFNETLRNSEDFELWWRMGLAGANFAYLDGVYLTRYKPLGTLSGSIILACENNLKALDVCLEETLSRGRQDLFPHLRTPYRNTWQNLILLNGKNGNQKKMFKAFFQSLRYGFRLGSLRLLVEGLLNINNSKRKIPGKRIDPKAGSPK